MNTAIILAGGTGVRLHSNIPKQYLAVQGKPVIAYSLEKFLDNDVIDAIQIVADDAWHAFIRQSMGHNQYLHKLKGFSRPGKNRQLSILNGLEDVKQYAPDDSCIMIHDAARPLVEKEFIKACFARIGEHDGVMPVLSMKDTVYLSCDGKRVDSLLDRKKVFAGQAPEVFRLGVYYHANRALSSEQLLRVNGSTEPAVMAGLDIVMIDGDEGNFKITTEADLERFRQKVLEKTV
ncbi:MAG: 2-C-methyl-D-erythritol 4-phosphate cytidylyltransferase [bacterium]|nr:2-C-methyl-D-erythritol 4-phosphate cytidylyltransferase [bacterium]MCM1374647.1 2-C-methyl-D-erythritol 4-phosphate cytidylyltransferase [Muribaculum sp.]